MTEMTKADNEITIPSILDPAFNRHQMYMKQMNACLSNYTNFRAYQSNYKNSIKTNNSNNLYLAGSTAADTQMQRSSMT